MALMGFGDFNDMFGHVDRMMNNIMRNMFNPMGADQFGMMSGFSNMAGGSFVSSSSVMITNDGSGRPQVYQATKTARYGPGGVAETQETVRDSASGLQKMAIGHHINDRGHVIEKSKNWYTGEEEEKNELINLDEEEQQVFEDEWKTRMYSQHQGSNHLAIAAGPSCPQQNQLQIQQRAYNHPQQHQQQAYNLHPHHHQQRAYNHHPHQHQQQAYNHHPHTQQQRAYAHHHRINPVEINAANFRCDPDIEIISGSVQAPAAGPSQRSSSRHGVPSKQRSKKDKKPYKRSLLRTP